MKEIHGAKITAYLVTENEVSPEVAKEDMINMVEEMYLHPMIFDDLYSAYQEWCCKVNPKQTKKKVARIED